MAPALEPLDATGVCQPTFPSVPLSAIPLVLTATRTLLVVIKETNCFPSLPNALVAVDKPKPALNVLVLFQVVDGATTPEAVLKVLLLENCLELAKSGPTVLASFLAMGVPTANLAWMDQAVHGALAVPLLSMEPAKMLLLLRTLAGPRLKPTTAQLLPQPMVLLPSALLLCLLWLPSWHWLLSSSK